ncbi:ThuA domain-containing protein [Streptomyces sp. RKAG293]|uniref:ThuA domain-containing protein n=1 Tax=Streptomyces sp. RKAG293 TaxID=2893403 RepID=UPI0027E59508|nr:ThuA domain-containing protein [Streptomyces sp. RKAG293]
MYPPIRFRRRHGARRRPLLPTLAAALLGLLAPFALTCSAQAAPSFKVLVFSKTAGFRHDSIPAGIAAIQKLGQDNGFGVDATEDGAAFTTADLGQYRAVIWLSTTGDVLDAAQQSAFEQYIRSGGGYAGVHAAADTEYDWPWYGSLVGAYFDSHPAIQQAAVTVEDRTDPATAHLPARWTRTDEWYNYRANPRPQVHVLTALDESSYSGGTMGGDHPNTWCHPYDGGRAWYTGMGHTQESWADPAFTTLVLGGIRTVAGAVASACNNPVGSPGGTTVQGEAWSSQSGVQAAAHAAAHGGATAGYIDNGDWSGYAALDPRTASTVSVRVASAGAGGTIGFHSGSATGPLLGSVAVPVTGSWETFTNVSTPLAAGTAPGLYLTYSGGQGALFDVDDITLTPGSTAPTTTTLQAENWTSQNGVQAADHAGAHGARTAGYIEAGDWIAFAGEDTSHLTRISLRVASAGSGGTTAVHAGSPTGQLLGTVTVPVTGSWDTFADVAASLTPSAGTGLYLVFNGGGGFLFDVDDLTLTRTG